MNTLAQLAHGFAVAFTPANLLWCLLGTTLGTAIGVLPGLGPALTIALLLPITYQVAPEASFILFAGIYYGAMYGGSTTSILLNTPGESATIVTALEGNKMARSGRGGAALATSAIGSFVAGTLGTLGVAFLAPVVVKFALAFGPAEYFSLMVLAFITVSAVLGSSSVRGLTSLFAGFVIGMIGVDLQTGQPRFTFGMTELLDGVDVIICAVGLFAVGETLYMASRRYAGKDEIVPLRGSLYMTAAEWGRSWKAWLRGAAIGFPIGAMPAGGAEIPTFLSYAVEKKLSKHRHEFGTVGAIEGVAGPEAANNASAAGTLVPLLTLGLPTSATAAMMLAGFQQYGLNPGPPLFADRPDLVWGLIASLLVANLMLLVLNLPLIGLWVKLLTIPTPWLYAGILMFATLGTIGANPSTFELGMLLAFGLLGYGLRRFHYPIAPVVVGLILGPLAEQQLRRAVAISQGDPS
ncbi:tripartite tricarboxylate transporter permease, partial [Nostoc ellipsosporum NOK]|nr:tripartite tricarboxylate transporter permease [Nostoc ellipsosporum NOK]